LGKAVRKSRYECAWLRWVTGLNLVLAVVVAFVLPCSPSRANDSSIHWAKNLPAAIDEARRDKKYVLADFCTDWCVMCKAQDHRTFTDPGVIQYLNERFVCVKVDAEDKGNGQQAAQRFDIREYPCAVVFDQKGRRIGKFTGFMSNDWYLSRLSAIINKPLKDPADFDSEIVSATKAGSDARHLARLYLARAKASLAHKDFQISVKDCTRAIQLNPQFAEAYVERATARLDNLHIAVEVAENIKVPVRFISKSTGVAATEDLDSAVRLKPDLAEAYAVRASVEMPVKAYNRAIDDFTTAIRLQPGLRDYYLERGKCYLLSKQYQKASDNYTEAISKGCASASVYFWRGVAFLLATNYGKARQDLDEAIRLEPDQWKYSVRGLICLSMGLSDDAIADFNRAIKLSDGYEYYYVYRARAHEQRNQLDQALADYTEAINRAAKYHSNHGGSDIYMSRAGVYWKRGDIGHACADRLTAIKLPIEYNVWRWVMHCRRTIARFTGWNI